MRPRACESERGMRYPSVCWSESKLCYGTMLWKAMAAVQAPRPRLLKMVHAAIRTYYTAPVSAASCHSAAAFAGRLTRYPISIWEMAVSISHLPYH